MTRPQQALNLSTALTGEALTPEHQRFQKLMNQLEQARQRLQLWQEQLPLFSQGWQRRIQPEQARLQQLRRGWAFDLEQLLLARRWSRGEAETLTQELLNLCSALLADEDPPDAELKALYNRHADVDFDTETQLDLQGMKQMLEHAADLDLGDEPVTSAEALMEKARERLAQRDAQERQAWQQAAEAARKPPRKKQTAAAKRAEEDAQQASQTVRAVYRKLAAALHPDRVATSASAEDRAQATQLMQRANAAYEAGDLLALLTLQLQIEQVDQAQASRMAASQVRHFNKVLAAQLKELEAEIDGRQQALQASYGLRVDGRLDPARLGKLLTEVVAELQAAAQQLAQRKRLLTGEPALAKRFVKQLQAEQRFNDRLPGPW